MYVLIDVYVSGRPWPTAIIVTWSGALYHVEWMRSYWSLDQPRREASRVIQWYGLIHVTWYCTPDQVTSMIICLSYTFFWHYSDFITCFGLYSRKNCGNVCHYVTFLDVTSSCFRLWFHAWKLLYVPSPQKQETDVSLVLKDSDTESENSVRWSGFLYQIARKQTVQKMYHLKVHFDIIHIMSFMFIWTNVNFIFRGCM